LLRLLQQIQPWVRPFAATLPISMNGGPALALSKIVTRARLVGR